MTYTGMTVSEKLKVFKPGDTVSFIPKDGRGVRRGKIDYIDTEPTTPRVWAFFAETQTQPSWMSITRCTLEISQNNVFDLNVID